MVQILKSFDSLQAPDKKSPHFQSLTGKVIQAQAKQTLIKH